MIQQRWEQPACPSTVNRDTKSAIYTYCSNVPPQKDMRWWYMLQCDPLSKRNTRSLKATHCMISFIRTAQDRETHRLSDISSNQWLGARQSFWARPSLPSSALPTHRAVSCPWIPRLGRSPGHCSKPRNTCRVSEWLPRTHRAGVEDCHVFLWLFFQTRTGHNVYALKWSQCWDN